MSATFRLPTPCDLTSVLPDAVLAGQVFFTAVPYGGMYFLRTRGQPLPGTQLALPRVPRDIVVGGPSPPVAAGPTPLQSNFTVASHASAAGGYAVTPSFVPKPGSTTNFTLLLQDTEARTC